MILESHLKRQMDFSHATFGPGERMDGVLDHMRKEIEEVRESGGDPEEWVDLVILAMDGLTRCLTFKNGRHHGPNFVARKACHLIEAKQSKNESRNWPDWRNADPGKAIEHVRDNEGSQK